MTFDVFLDKSAEMTCNFDIEREHYLLKNKAYTFENVLCTFTIEILVVTVNIDNCVFVVIEAREQIDTVHYWIALKLVQCITDKIITNLIERILLFKKKKK